MGLDLSGVAFALHQEAVDDPQFHCNAHFVLMNYFASTQETAILPNHEVVEWAWLSPEQALTYPLNSYTRILVQHSIERGLPRGAGLTAPSVLGSNRCCRPGLATAGGGTTDRLGGQRWRQLGRRLPRGQSK